MRAALAAASLLPTPSPQRYLLEQLCGAAPLSAHLRALETGLDGDVIHVGDLGARRGAARLERMRRVGRRPPARARAPPARAAR